MTVRQMFVFDPKVINEQQCREDALEMIAKGREGVVVIHKHKDQEPCPMDVLHLLNTKAQLIDPRQCYRFSKETK